MSQWRHNEAIAIAQAVLEKRSIAEITDEFGISTKTMQRRLNSIGYTYTDLVKLRKSREEKKS